MNTPATKKPKDRILDASAQLFYSQDAHTVGVDRICEVADVSKRTLYKHFPTKELLVSSALSAFTSAWDDAYMNFESEDPIECITNVFSMLEPRASTEEFRGCMLMNTSVELRGLDGAAKDVAKRGKHRLFHYFKQQANLLGVKNPEVLAEQLVLLFDGCNAWIIMNGEFPASTYNTLEMLLAQAEVRP